MRTPLAAALVAFALAGITSASAMPAAPSGMTGSDIIKVAQGCGPGFHRGPYGRCLPNGVFRRPIIRACPPGFFRTPRGACVRRW
jgi:hypothetical protein